MPRRLCAARELLYPRTEAELALFGNFTFSQAYPARPMIPVPFLPPRPPLFVLRKIGFVRQFFFFPHSPFRIRQIGFVRRFFHKARSVKALKSQRNKTDARSTTQE